MPRPTADVVHRIHDRYLLEIVEGLNLCPFARRSREQGRVHRPLFWVEGESPSAHDAAERLREVVTEHPDAEIVLLTFIDQESRFDDPDDFDRFVAAMRDAYAAGGGPRYFAVGFHPRLGSKTPEPITKDSLVPLLRRSPDPVIQCVNAAVLEAVRRQAQAAAHARMVERFSRADPKLRALVENSVQPDSELSADIARSNFEAVGGAQGRADLERKIAAIHQARDEAYGR